jgi:hypothetical protein
MRFFSLVGVGGKSVPVVFDHFQGPILWSREDGWALRYGRGGMVCNPDGAANEGYVFWGDGWVRGASVDLSLECELHGTDAIFFRNPETGETITANVRGGAGENQDCHYLSKRLPSGQSFRAGRVTSGNYESFPPDVVSTPVEKVSFVADENGTLG